MTMKRTSILSSIILLACIFLSLTIVMAAFEQSKDLTKAKKSLKDYNERMSAPVDALDPLSVGGASLGELVIPKLGVDCTIRSDTVNAYNAVYHYPESAAPGQPGECGILGHRTTYSGLFKNLGSLQVGDKVIIIDTVMKKKYTYSVTSNGDDIRWDYKTNPVRFAQEGEARLMLMTCYPPGKKEAAFITHCKLISTDDI
jgi:sortase A